MDEARLAEIEARAQTWRHIPRSKRSLVAEDLVTELIAEVRRLREIDRRQELLAEVMMHPEKYPDIHRRAREMADMRRANDSPGMPQD